MLDETMRTYAQIADTFFEVQHTRPERHVREFGRFLDLLAPNALILDVGAGPGVDAAILRKHGHRAIAIDLSLEMMLAGRPTLGGSYVQANMCQMPFCTAQFDALWVSASLLHLPQTEAQVALGEFARLLKRNGVMFMTVKEGIGEEMTAQAYGYQLGRYFNYWNSAEFDAFLSQKFTVIDGWRYDRGEGTGHPWLVRFTKKRL